MEDLSPLIHEQGRRDRLVQTRCRDGREQPRQPRLAAQRHLTRRQPVGNRVFWEVESTQLWIGDRICTNDHTAVLGDADSACGIR